MKIPTSTCSASARGDVATRPFRWCFFLLLFSICCLTLFSTQSCSESEEFTTDSAALLTFEKDTIQFDTVFSSIGSSTQRIKIFNHNSKGIRVQRVVLASGGASGFRINVDGHSGVQISDVEVLDKDSIFMFAEVTVNPGNSDTPLLLRDSVQFFLENGRMQQLILEAYGQDVVILRAPKFTSDTTLDAKRPYVIYDSLTVGADATLTMAAGTVLCFSSEAFVRVDGRLLCQGQQDAPVVFRGMRTDRIFSYLPYDRMSAQWGGILISGQSSGNVLDHVDVHGGRWGIELAKPLHDKPVLTLRNSELHNVSREGLSVKGSRVVAENCQISNAGAYCVSLEGGESVFTHCTIAQFYPWTGQYGSALYFSNSLGEAEEPLLRADFHNCVITGAVADMIAGNPRSDSDAAFNANFDGSLVNIHLTGKEPETISAMFEHAKNEYELFPSSTSSSSASSGSDEAVYGSANFRRIDTDNYLYDFRLDSLSNARGIGLSQYAASLPLDKDGKVRPQEAADAGCYQW